jgi:hypothetical protein
MGRGGDLTDHERSFVFNKIMQNWNSELKQIKVGGRKKIIQACVEGGVRVCESTINRVAREAKLQEEESERHFQKTGKFKGMNLGACREGKCGKKSKLTDEVKEAYREIVSRFAYSWTYLSEATLQEELKKKGLNFSAGTVHNHLLLLRKRNKKVYLKPMLTEHNKMSCDGGNDYRQAHNGGKKRKRETGSAIDLTVNLVDYDRCVRLCR